MIKRALIKDEINQTMKNEDKKEATRNKHADGLKDKVKDGFMEANPLIQAAMEIGQGIHGMMTRGKVEDRKKSALQKVNQKNTSVNPSSVSATAPAAAATTSAPANASTSIASDIIGSIGSFISGIASGFSKVSKFLSKGVKFIPIIGTVAAVIGGIFDFMEGFNDASSLFGEKIADDDYVKRIYSGFTSVVGSILGIFDTVAGWLGFDTNLEGSFKEGAVKLFNTILDCFKSVVGGLASLLSYIPGMGDTAAKMKAYASSGSSTSAPEGPSAASTISDKQNNVNNLTDEVEASKSKSSQIQVNADNSVKTNSTTIVNDRMSTRNDDRIYEMYI